MNSDHSAALLAPFSEAELTALELRWYSGQLLRHVEWLLGFADRHRTEILALAAESPDPAALLLATKQLIVQRGSVHLAGELKDQLREIENELWYRGKEGDFDRSRIQLDWTAAHAATWRRWRIREYIFVTGRCEARVLAILALPPPPSAPRPA